MFGHVLFKSTGISTCVSAFGALIRFFSSVDAEVGFQSACMSKRAPAPFTMMWLFSTVGEKMLGEA